MKSADKCKRYRVFIQKKTQLLHLPPFVFRQSYPDQHGGRVASGGDVLSCPDQHGGHVASGGDVFPLLSGAPLAQYGCSQTLLH